MSSQSSTTRALTTEVTPENLSKLLKGAISLDNYLKEEYALEALSLGIVRCGSTTVNHAFVMLRTVKSWEAHWEALSNEKAVQIRARDAEQRRV